MEISRKHLEMIRFAINKHISDLEFDADQLGAEYIITDLKAYRELGQQIEELILRQ